MNPKQQDPSKQNPQPDRPADPKPDQPIAKRDQQNSQNEGEGNRTAAREYDNNATRFAHSGTAKDPARKAG